MKKMKKMSKREMNKLMDEFDEVAPPIDELSGYERVDAWIEWLKVRLECPTIEQLEVRMGMKILG
jgi:hypothetical protein